MEGFESEVGKIFYDIDHERNPSEEFKQLLSSLPKDLACRQDQVWTKFGRTVSGEVTPLQYCVERWDYFASTSRAEHLQLLLDHGMDPGAVTSTEARTAIEIAADDDCEDAFKILAPVMEGTEALKKSQEVMNTRATLNELIEQIDSEPVDSPSQEFRANLSSLPLEKLSSGMALPGCPTITLLQNCALLNKVEHARILLQLGVNPASVCVWQNTEKTPIEVAAERSNEYLFNILAPLMKGTEALKNSNDIINKSKVKELVEQIEDDGEIPSSEFKELLSSVPADLARSKGILPVQCAAKEGRAGHLRLLLDHGFDPAAVTEDTKETAIELAAEGGHGEVFTILAPAMEGSVAFQLAKLIQILRSKGSIEATDEPTEEFLSILSAIPTAELRVPVVCEMTMLQAFAEAGNVAFTRLFLEKGFDPAGVTNQNPKTPLDLAFESNNNKLEVLVVLADYVKFADIPNHIKTSSEWQIVQMERSASRNKKQEQEIQKLHDELKTMKEMLSQVLAKVVDK